MCLTPSPDMPEQDLQKTKNDVCGDRSSVIAGWLEPDTAEERVRQIPDGHVMCANNPGRVFDAHAAVAEEAGVCSERAPDR